MKLRTVSFSLEQFMYFFSKIITFFFCSRNVNNEKNVGFCGCLEFVQKK